MLGTSKFTQRIKALEQALVAAREETAALTRRLEEEQTARQEEGTRIRSLEDRLGGELGRVQEDAKILRERLDRSEGDLRDGMHNTGDRINAERHEREEALARINERLDRMDRAAQVHQQEGERIISALVERIEGVRVAANRPRS